MKLQSVQLLRALAAWAVVFHHVEQTFYGFQPHSFWGWFFATKGSTGVDLFFVISGFVMVISTHNKPLSGSEFLIRRLTRIVPSYWLFTVLMSLALILFPILERWPFRLDSVHFVLSLGFLSGFFKGHFYPVLSVGWSLNFEMVFYLLFACSLSLASRLPVQVRVWILPITMLALQLFPSHLSAAQVVKAPLMLVFLLGYGLGTLFVRDRLPVSRSLGWILIGVGLALLVAYASSPSFFGRGIGRGISSFLILWGALCFRPEASTLKWKLAGHGGDWSYATYLLHPIVLQLAKYGLDRSQTGPAEVWISVSLVLILVLSWLSFAKFELPTMRFLQGLYRRS